MEDLLAAAEVSFTTALWSPFDHITVHLSLITFKSRSSHVQWQQLSLSLKFPCSHPSNHFFHVSHYKTCNKRLIQVATIPWASQMKLRIHPMMRTRRCVKYKEHAQGYLEDGKTFQYDTSQKLKNQHVAAFCCGVLSMRWRCLPTYRHLPCCAARTRPDAYTPASRHTIILFIAFSTPHLSARTPVNSNLNGMKDPFNNLRMQSPPVLSSFPKLVRAYFVFHHIYFNRKRLKHMLLVKKNKTDEITIHLFLFVRAVALVLQSWIILLFLQGIPMW